MKPFVISGKQFLPAGCLSCFPVNSVKAVKETSTDNQWLHSVA